MSISIDFKKLFWKPRARNSKYDEDVNVEKVLQKISEKFWYYQLINKDWIEPMNLSPIYVDEWLFFFPSRMENSWTEQIIKVIAAKQYFWKPYLRMGIYDCVDNLSKVSIDSK